LQQLNYDTYRMITFHREEGLWFGDARGFRFIFSPGLHLQGPVAINQVIEGKPSGHFHHEILSLPAL
jgi:glucan biosynthesis protein